jgi:hypothetical protein
MYYSRKLYIDVFKLLIDEGADVSIKEINKCT